jgi:hypothetical protein
MVGFDPTTGLSAQDRPGVIGDGFEGLGVQSEACHFVECRPEGVVGGSLGHFAEGVPFAFAFFEQGVSVF